MRVRLLGGIQDGREIDMGPSWPGSYNCRPPEFFRQPVIRPMNQRILDLVETREIPSADLPVENWPLHSYDRETDVVTYRMPGLKL